MANVMDKTRADRLADIKKLQSAPQVQSVPFVTSDGKITEDGKIILVVDVLALEDGYKMSSKGKSNVNFQCVNLNYLGRLNITAIRKI